MRRVGTLAEEYRRNRKTGASALTAFHWAKSARETSAFWYRAEGVSKYKTSFCNTDGADVWQIESKSGAIRAEIAIMPDYDGGLDLDHGTEDYASFRRYFRDTAKLGRNAAHLAALKALRQYEEDQKGEQSGSVYGVAVRVFHNVPQLESGDPIGEDSLWGIIIADDDDGERYLWECAAQVYAEATAGLCGKIRQQRREAFRAVMAEAFAANFAI